MLLSPMKTYRLIASALLAALAFILQISNDIIGIPTGFGMTIDLAAVPVLIALFVFGAEYAIMVLALLSLMILTTASTGYIGALMKMAATIPMIAVPYFMAREHNAYEMLISAVAVILITLALFGVSAEFAKMPGLELLAGILPLAFILVLGYWVGKSGGSVSLSDWKIALGVLALAALTRSTIMTLANLYFAGPVFFQVSPAEFIGMLDNLVLPLFGSGMGWFVIFFWNIVLSILEFTVAWIPAYYFGLAKRHSE